MNEDIKVGGLVEMAREEGVGGEEIVLPEPPKKRSKIWFIFILCIGLAIAVGFMLFGGKKQNEEAQSSLPTPVPQDLSRYSTDTDEDRIPDFIEEKLGFNHEFSELERCFNSKCSATNTEEIARIPRNVMILLDSSGSMSQKVGEQTKMEAAKIAIREYLKKAEKLESTRVGLIVYGDKGSNSQADKGISCTSIETKVELGELKLETIEQDLADIRPAGWTPIGLALKEAAESFIPKEKETGKEIEKPTQVINEVVVISDGVETCDSDPLGQAKLLFEGSEKIIVHVIGFAVAEADNESLRAISRAAEGTYATAPTIDELKLAMDLQWDNYVRRAKEEACRVKGYDTYLACKDDTWARLKAYISQELSRDPKELTYEEKLKIDRIRYTFPAYMAGTLDPAFTSSPRPSTETPN